MSCGTVHCSTVRTNVNASCSHVPAYSAHGVFGQWQWLMASITFLTFLTDFSVGTAVNAAEGISPTFMFTSLLFLLTVSAEYFSATFSVSLTYLVACLTSALLSTTESVIASEWRLWLWRETPAWVQTGFDRRLLALYAKLRGLKMTEPTLKRSRHGKEAIGSPA